MHIGHVGTSSKSSGAGRFSPHAPRRGASCSSRRAMSTALSPSVASSRRSARSLELRHGHAADALRVEHSVRQTDDEGCHATGPAAPLALRFAQEQRRLSLLKTTGGSAETAPPREARGSEFALSSSFWLTPRRCLPGSPRVGARTGRWRARDHDARAVPVGASADEHLQRRRVRRR